MIITRRIFFVFRVQWKLFSSWCRATCFDRAAKLHDSFGGDRSGLEFGDRHARSRKWGLRWNHFSLVAFFYHQNFCNLSGTPTSIFNKVSDRIYDLPHFLDKSQDFAKKKKTKCFATWSGIFYLHQFLSCFEIKCWAFFLVWAVKKLWNTV